MNQKNPLIQPIEEALQIQFGKVEEGASIIFKNDFTTDEAGNIIELTLYKLNLESLEVLIPIAPTLKHLELFECILPNPQALEILKNFSALESLDLEVQSVEIAQEVLSLDRLKKLDLFLAIEPEPTSPILLNLQKLKNLQELTLRSGEHLIFEGIGYLEHLTKLVLDCETAIEGLEQLKKLEYLHLYHGEQMDIHKVPPIPSLKILDLDVEREDEIRSLEQFPNLEKLKIQACHKINLGRLEKLKVLILQWVELETTSIFDHLPNLEQLDLSYNDITVLQNLEKLTNLKTLNLSENFEIEDISVLEKLQSLEYLNLYDNKITDIRILNKLPNLKQVNLARNNVDEKDVEEQLDKPEIACFMYLPRVPFFIKIN